MGFATKYAKKPQCSIYSVRINQNLGRIAVCIPCDASLCSCASKKLCLNVSKFSMPDQRLDKSCERLFKSR